MRVERIHAGHILGAGAVLGPILGVFAPNLIAFLTIFLVVALLVRHFLRHEPFPRLDRGLLAVLAFAAIWSALSLIWTIQTANAAEKWAEVFLIAPMALVAFSLAKGLSPVERATVRNAAIIGVVAAILLVAFELATHGFLTQIVHPGKEFTIGRFNRTPSTVLILLWPAAAALWLRSRVAALILAGAGIVFGAVLPSGAALAGFVVGLVIFAIAWFATRITPRVLGALMILGVMLSPLMSSTIAAPDRIRDAFVHINPSLMHRLLIWDFASRHIAQKPLTGWGFDSSRAIPGGAERIDVKDREGNVIGRGSRLPLHPHDGALQVWLELGLPGALALSAFLGMVAWRAGAIEDRSQCAMTLGMLTTMVPIWLFSFGVWQGWWLGVLLLGILLMAATRAESP